MFLDADVFNQAVGKWDVSKVTDMKRVLSAAARRSRVWFGWLPSLTRLYLLPSQQNVQQQRVVVQRQHHEVGRLERRGHEVSSLLLLFFTLVSCFW